MSHEASPMPGKLADAQQSAGPDAANSPWAATLLHVVDAALAGVIFCFPYAMGGRHPIGQLVLVALVAVLATAWFARQCVIGRGRWYCTGGGLLVAAAVVLVGMQMIALPGGMRDRLSPAMGHLLPLWLGESENFSALGSWSRTSFTPAVTRDGMVMLLTYGLLFLVVAQRIGRLEDVERLLKWIALSAAAMATFALLQYLAGNGKFLWFYDHPYRGTDDSVKGSFVNRNHYAHFLALGIGPCIWWVQSALRQRTAAAGAGGFRRRESSAGSGIALPLLALAVVVFGGLMSLSRGSSAMILLALLVSIGLYFWTGLLGRKLVAGIVGVVLLTGTALFIHGYDSLSGRLDDLATGDVDEIDRGGTRRMIWAADAAAVSDFWILGTGVGSHREIYKTYLDDPWPLEFSHAECGYLQILLETGVGGLVLLAVGIALCGFWCVRGWMSSPSATSRAALAAIVPGLVVSVLHSIFDFVWYIPACMALTLLLVVCAGRLWHFARAQAAGTPLEQSRHVAVPRLGWVAVAILVSLLGMWCVRDRFGPAMAAPHWDQYIRTSIVASGGKKQKGFHEGLARSTQTPEEAALSLDLMIAELELVLWWNPDDARAHVQLAGSCLRRFDLAQQQSENAMVVSQIREAALASQFRTRQAQDQWLARALGERREYLDRALRHAHRGVELCPLQGEGYLYLADLCFLEGAVQEAKSAYVSQALVVRPYDGNVLFEAGREAMLAGDQEQMMAHWKRSFDSGYLYQRRLVEMLAGQVPVEFFLENFDPPLSGLRLMHGTYTALGQTDKIEQLLPAYIAALEEKARVEEGDEATRYWLEAYKLYRQLGRLEGMLASAGNAVTVTPHHFQARYAMGVAHCEAGQYAEAEPHLKWCIQRKPNDSRLRQVYEEAVRGRVDAETQATAPAKTTGRQLR